MMISMDDVPASLLSPPTGAGKSIESGPIDCGTRWMKLLVCLLIFQGIAGCAGANVMKGDVVFQRFGFGNDGAGRITEARIQYGHIKLPTASNINYPPNHMTIFSETMTTAVPENAHITWHSQDGHPYEVDAPIRSLIRNPKLFYGFRFYFVDDHVDIYLTERINNPGPYLDVKYTKVYSSSATGACVGCNN